MRTLTMLLMVVAFCAVMLFATLPSAQIQIERHDPISYLSGNMSWGKFSTRVTQGSYWLRNEFFHEYVQSVTYLTFKDPNFPIAYLVLPYQTINLDKDRIGTITVQQVSFDFSSFPDALFGGGAIPDSITREHMDYLFELEGPEIGELTGSEFSPGPDSLWIYLNPKKSANGFLQLKISLDLAWKKPQEKYYGPFWFEIKFQKEPYIVIIGERLQPTTVSPVRWGEFKKKFN